MATKQDYYKVLGVSKEVSNDDLKKSYRKLAMQYHPDRNPGNAESEKKFKEINEAYDTLKDEQKRAAYDKFGHNAPHSSGGGGFQSGQGFEFDIDVENIFDMFGFGGGAKQSKAQNKSRGSDLQYNLNISLEEAFSGCNKNISFTSDAKCDDCNGSGSRTGSVKTCGECKGNGSVHVRQGFFVLERPCPLCQGAGQVVKDPCGKCSGKGRVKKSRNLSINIPIGVTSGMRLRKTGEGEAGYRGSSAGDLYISINITPHAIFKVDDRANMHCQVPISFTTLTLGGEVEIQDIEGQKVSLRIPAGTQYGEQIVIKGKGMTTSNAKNRGNLIAHVLIHIPKNINSKQRELLQELDKEMVTAKSSESLFERMKNLWK